MTKARDAGLGWLAPDAWGVETTANPASLAPLLQAIDRAAPGLKIALFDDTTSAVLRKNRARGHGWTLDVRFDLSDFAGTGEGGLEDFYDQQWKRFFQTVPPAYRLTIDGRPVVFMWHGGFEWYTRQNFFHGLIDALRQSTRRDFGVDPFVIVEESWLRLDPAAGVDGVFDWFEPGRSFATLMTRNGIRVGHVVPGYDCSRCAPAGPVILRQAESCTKPRWKRWRQAPISCSSKGSPTWTRMRTCWTRARGAGCTWVSPSGSPSNIP